MKRRKNMCNEERIEVILKTLHKNEKYRAFIYCNHIFTWVFIIGIPMVLSLLSFILNSKSVRLIFLFCILILVLIISISVILAKYFRKRKDDLIKKSRIIKSKVSVKMTTLTSPGNYYISMGKYKFYSYYVEKDRTYQFSFVVRDDQHDLFSILCALVEKGKFPDVKIYNYSNKYSKYFVKEEYIRELLYSNKEIVYDILDYYYNS